MNLKPRLSPRLSAGQFGTLLGATVVISSVLVPFFPFWMSRARGPAVADIPVSVVPPPRHVRRRVLLFVLDGVGARVAYGPGRMPLLQARLPAAAYGVARARFPTVTPSGLRAIMSGHGNPPSAETPGSHPPPEEDSLLRRASEAGLRAFVVGQQYWTSMFDGHGARMTIVPFRGYGPEYDEPANAAARAVLLDPRSRWDLLVVHFFGPDPEAHAHGTEGPEYRARLRRVDRYVFELSRLAGPEVTFVVTADHGQKPGGNHGGTSDEETQVPLILYGEGILHGRLSGRYAHDDVPATVSVLLGLPPPRECDGQPVLAGLDMTERGRAWALSAALEQKRRIWLAARRTWPWLRGDPDQAVERVRALEKRYDWKRASTTAKSAIGALDQRMAQASPVRWFGRYVAAEWMLAAACCLFAFLWFEVPSVSVAAVPLCLGAIGACALSMATPRFCPEASLAGLVFSAALLGMVFRQGYRAGAAPWTFWMAAGFGFLGLALPMIIDAGLWAWIVLLAAACGLAFDGPRSRSIALCGASVAFLALGWIVGPFAFASEGSLLRGLLPIVQPLLRPPWGAVEWLLLAAATAALWISLDRVKVRTRFFLVVAACLPPIFSLLPITDTAYLSFAWSAAAVSAALSFFVPLPARTRGFWMALELLAFHRTLAQPAAGARLMLAALLGWTFSSDHQKHAPALPALTLTALALWGYSMAGYTLSATQLSISQPYQMLGVAWHPRVLVSLIILRQVAAFFGPILPMAGACSEAGVAAAVPLWAALSCGEMLSLWLDRFVLRREGGWVDENVFARALTAATVAAVFFLIALAKRVLRKRRPMSSILQVL